jgi:hypothetical protein
MFIKKHICLLLLLVSTLAWAADKADDAKDAVTKMFTWRVEQTTHGPIMFLDVPYKRDKQKKLQFITLSVAKETNNPRPSFVSIILPNDVVRANGVFLNFANTVKSADGSNMMQLEKEDMVRAKFDNCDKDDCEARVVDGYATNEETNQTIDVFQKMMDTDHILFLFSYSDGTHKSVALPLATFKKQYKELLNEKLIIKNK